FFFIRKNREVGEHQVLQGLMVYQYPYDSDSAFEAGEAAEVMRDYISAIKGQPKGFMTVEQQYPVLSEETALDGKYTLKLSGLWKMQDIFMGGSFIHYTTLHPDNKTMVGIYGFVYAPK